VCSKVPKGKPGMAHLMKKTAKKPMRSLSATIAALMRQKI